MILYRMERQKYYQISVGLFCIIRCSLVGKQGQMEKIVTRRLMRVGKVSVMIGIIKADGLRCDFGQGLPPRCWEYIINVARSYKWNFVMMSESLDGDEVTYRSNRHFDILNENIVFSLRSAGNKYDYISAFEDRRSQYDQGYFKQYITR